MDNFLVLHNSDDEKMIFNLSQISAITPKGDSSLIFVWGSDDPFVVSESVETIIEVISKIQNF